MCFQVWSTLEIYSTALFCMNNWQIDVEEEKKEKEEDEDLPNQSSICSRSFFFVL